MTAPFSKDQIKAAMSTASPPLAEVGVATVRQSSLSPVVIAGLWRFAELLVLLACGFVVQRLYVYPEQGWGGAYLLGIPLLALVASVLFQSSGLYKMSALRAPFRQAPRLFTAWSMTFLLVFALVFFLKLEGTFSRVFAVGWYLSGIGMTLIGRIAMAVVIRKMTRRGLLDRRTVIVGGGEQAETLLRELANLPDQDLRIVGVFDDRGDDRTPDLIAGYPRLGTVDDLVAYARRERVDFIIFALPVTAEDRILHMLRKVNVLPADIRLAAHAQKIRFRARTYSFIAGLPFYDMADRPMADWDIVTKWLFDKCVGSLMLILLSPVMLAVAIAVKLTSRGPVFFKQRRYGFNNELIEVFKFRSMYVEQSDATASRLVTKNDPRVTPVGRIIRKTSLDELPQLINVVFKGNLSLVGPRPHATHAKAVERLYDEVVDGYFARHRVKPGITGWAQVNGWRGETDTEEKLQRRVEHDLEYIENWSIGFDIQILLMTPLSLLKTEHAY